MATCYDFFVRHRLLLPIYFVLVTALFTMLGAGCATLAYLVSYPEAWDIPSLLAARFLSVLLESFLLSFLLTWVWAWTYLRRRSLPTFLHGLVLFLFSTAVLSFGAYFIAGLSQAARENPIALSHGIRPGELHRSGDSLILAQKAGPLLLEQVYVRQTQSGQDGEVIPLVPYDEGREELILDSGLPLGAGETQVALAQLSGYRPSIPREEIQTSLSESLDLGPLADSAFDGIRRLASVLSAYGETVSVRLFVMAACLSLFCAGAGFFQRGRVWAALAPVSGLLVNFAGMALFWLLTGTEIQTLAGEFLQDRSLGYLGPAVLGGLGMFFMALAGLWPAAGKKKVKETGGEDEE